MNTRTRQTIRLNLTTGLVLSLGLLGSLNGKGAVSPFSVLQQSQLVESGTTNVQFQVGRNCKPFKPKAKQTFQWFFNGSPITYERAGYLGVQGFTNNTLTVISATGTNVGFYQCAIGTTSAYDNVELTDPVELNIVHYSVATPSATPIGGQGGTSGGCPPPYIGYAIYRLTSSPYGWPAPNGAVAVDTNRSDTVVAFFGSPQSNYGCGAGNGKVTVPSGTTCAYRYTIYFTNRNAGVPSGPYYLTITNF